MSKKKDDDKKPRNMKSQIKGAMSGTFRSIAEFSKSVANVITTETTAQKEQFIAALEKTKNTDHIQAILKHDYRKALLRHGSTVLCVGMACLTAVLINKNQT